MRWTRRRYVVSQVPPSPGPPAASAAIQPLFTRSGRVLRVASTKRVCIPLQTTHRRLAVPEPMPPCDATHAPTDAYVPAKTKRRAKSRADVACRARSLSSCCACAWCAGPGCGPCVQPGHHAAAHLRAVLHRPPTRTGAPQGTRACWVVWGSPINPRRVCWVVWGAWDMRRGAGRVYGCG